MTTMKKETEGRVAAPECAKRVFICSPFRGLGFTEEEAKKNFFENLRIAKLACRYATLHGAVPYAPHLYFPRFLMDQDEAEREKGMLMGQSWLAQCSELWVIGHQISEGMEKEIRQAEKWDIPIRHYIPRFSPEEHLLKAIFGDEFPYIEMV